MNFKVMQILVALFAVLFSQSSACTKNKEFCTLDSQCCSNYCHYDYENSQPNACTPPPEGLCFNGSIWLRCD
uniref:Uncharacterized protein n=1 Tax=Megaselia scalaris TaxID=36166 RepID=T1H3F9_MEGSC